MSVLKTDWLNGGIPKSEIASQPPAIAAIPAIVSPAIATIATIAEGQAPKSLQRFSTLAGTIATIAEGQSQISKSGADPERSRKDLLRRQIQDPAVAIDPSPTEAQDGIALLKVYQSATAKTYGTARHVLGWTATRAWCADHWLRTQNLHPSTLTKQETAK